AVLIVTKVRQPPEQYLSVEKTLRPLAFGGILYGLLPRMRFQPHRSSDSIRASNAKTLGSVNSFTNPSCSRKNITRPLPNKANGICGGCRARASSTNLSAREGRGRPR